MASSIHNMKLTLKTLKRYISNFFGFANLGARNKNIVTSCNDKNLNNDVFLNLITYLKNLSWPLFLLFSSHGEGAYEVWKYRNTVDFIVNYHCTGNVFDEIAIFRLRPVVELPNTEINLLKLPCHCPNNCQIR